MPVPGEVTLAHRGVLFLDELGEFPVSMLDALRQPVEDGSVVVARKGASVRFPSRFQMVAATNPCPCGYAGDHLVACRCTPRATERYQRSDWETATAGKTLVRAARPQRGSAA